MGNYDVALICKNGHMINDSYVRYPEGNSKHCEECGAENITSCQHCNAPIKGRYHVDGIVDFSETPVPSYCHNCGKPYPWIQSKLEALDEMINLMDELDEKEKESLKESGRDVSVNGPKTEVGVVKMKKYLGMVSGTIGETAKEIFIQIASETAIKAMEKQGII